MQTLKSINESNFGKYQLKEVSLDADKVKHYVSSNSPYICLLPFEKTEDNQISSVYILKYINPSTENTDYSLIVDEFDLDLESTSYDSVKRSLTEEAGLDIEALGITEDRIFYLGDITMSIPVNAKMMCYGIDLTNLSKDQIQFTRTLAKDHFIKDTSSIIKIGFHQLVNGDYSDSTILSGTFLLASYFV